MFQQIANYFARNNAVRKVAEDPAISAELLLLTKILFIDHECSSAEIHAFTQIVCEKFGIEKDELPDVVRYIRDFGYETSTAQAALIFAQFEPQRRVSLIQSLMQIAAADSVIAQEEVLMIERVAAIIGITPAEVEEMRNITTDV